MADVDEPPAQAGSTGTEGPRGHEARPPVDDAAVPWRVFLAVGAFVGLMAAIYASTSYEESGTALLAVAAVLALWCGAYLWLQRRPSAETPTTSAPGAPAGEIEYQPHASGWPFAIGLGVATVLNGLVLGIWVLVPGVGLMALGIGGFIAQSRRRD